MGNVRFWPWAYLAQAVVFGGCAHRGAATGPRGDRHVVARGDTLWSIAQRFGTSVAALQAHNGIADPTRLPQGHVLRIPGGRAASRRAPPAGGHVAASPPPRPGRRALAWPVAGALTSHFGARGGRPHDGIDIGAPAGTPVRAAADGHVVFASAHRGYGKVVILRHADGLMTVYAHHRKNRVSVGQRVRRGQAIAEVGQSGRATGPHLHFEVRHGARPANPLHFLPPGRPS